MTAPQMVDARGLRCPWPVLRLSRAARELGAPAAIRILVDDPIAPAELAQLCSERGWTIARLAEDPHAFDVLIPGS